MKKWLSLVLCLLLVLGTSSALAGDYTDTFTDFDLRDSWTAATSITFTEESVDINGSGAVADGTVVTITAAGVYLLTGSCSNGQVLVELDKTEKAQLVLSNLELHCENSAPLYVISADKVALTLAPDTQNSFSDGKAYTADFEKQPNACIYSRDDLVINGTGALSVQGNYNNGIGTKNDLRITGGNITVSAVKNALKGNDSVAILTGVITLTAGKDAIKADTTDKAGKGYVYIAGGELAITAGDDALQAPLDITVTGGVISVTAAGRAVNSKGESSIASGVINAK